MKNFLPGFLALALLLSPGCGSKKEDPAPVAAAKPVGPFTQAYVGYEWQGFTDVPVTVTKSLSSTASAAWTLTAIDDPNAYNYDSPLEFHPVVAGETFTVTVTIPRKPAAGRSHFLWVSLFSNKGMLATDNTQPTAKSRSRDVLPLEIRLYESDVMNAANYGPNGYVITRTVVLP